jgi:hypothetical protein
MFRFWSRSGGNQSVCTSAGQRWLDGLMAEMANRAGVRGRNGMTMTHSPERRSYHQHEERYREHRAPNQLLVRHFGWAPDSARIPRA